MAKFTIAPAAEADLDEIWHYIAEQAEQAADKFMRDLAGKFQLLANNREIGRREDDFIVEMRMFPFKNYHIYYFPTEEGVEIYRVLHGKRNIEELFEDYIGGLKE
ncbi:MAG: type II toxin-antitoxin system RelE/ParE family toxin [Acidobacteria bacterium]|nr:type II toxin-antitoxin system RelE/ParE family toxin [Acidobacteriota bacterium]MCA1640247.1 type II toxin-antitoxin system RelE/ParE family toxin [Acidobacteriota bacterium]